ncbi:XcbB/CpsF family capsular polysaccharide biosynthesis protein [Arthrobacter zhangbolii]|uniref:XcbB/CpsF family capsular polysaccharide biosynthesis protein n=1 Tax=Arthrobacter zhangbolii TaxID=2886936 RepID=A0A9X1M5W2_9MICC|nr:XcbB/CpsF family capsular polysaccharide biosynthesis protein [Arthrobacter zhangbolii]MCC3271147.1 XcbB/CpsF family capsular polysaccharide biosynthesis protein [Arthrobacter zhangbolii]UON91057.1 XcbB/CpsF family capsular polysaccharide biosynthesis protein [Arthrobacter zhangbolii]
MNSSDTLICNLEAPVHEILIQLKHKKYPFIELMDEANALAGRTILAAAHKDPGIKELIVKLAREGYYVYKQADEAVRFVYEYHIDKLWHSIKNGDFQVSDEGVVYKLHKPTVSGRARNLVVVFSSISADIFGTGLSRYFTQNFKSIQKYLPGDTAVLRVADIGGVVGSFYLDTVFVPQNTKRINGLIETVRTDLDLKKTSVITYGASKGATGALAHALIGDYRCVCVEPVINDHYYETKFGDTHFTADGLFAEKKEDTFSRMLEQHKRDTLSRPGIPNVNFVVVYSAQSPQSPYIREILGSRIAADTSLIDFRHPSISDHPDVSPQSLNLISMYLNMMCYGYPASSSGHFALECYPQQLEQTGS